MPSGSCLCGGVKFSVTSPPDLAMTCYCLDCRKNSGSSGQLLAKYETDDVTIDDPQGQLTTYVIEKTQLGKPKDKLFCGKCGCTIATKPQVYEGKVTILRLTLFDELTPEFELKKALFDDVKSEYFSKCPIN